jgi:hypothetical protein
MPIAPRPSRTASATASAFGDIAGAGAAAQKPSSQTSDAHCDDSSHSPPFGTGVFVRVGVLVPVGVWVGVSVEVGLMVEVGVWEPVMVGETVGVEVGLGRSWHWPGAVAQTALGVNVPPPSSHSDWVMMPLQLMDGSVWMQHPVGTHPHAWPTWRQPMPMGQAPDGQAVVDVISSHGSAVPA